MPKPTLDADTILKRAAPVAAQHAHEIQPVGYLVRMPMKIMRPDALWGEM